MRRKLPKHELFQNITWTEIISKDKRKRVVPDFMNHLQGKANYYQLQWIIDWWVLTGHRTDRMFLAGDKIDANPKTWPINRHVKPVKSKEKEEIDAYIKKQYGILAARKRPLKKTVVRKTRREL